MYNYLYIAQTYWPRDLLHRGRILSLLPQLFASTVMMSFVRSTILFLLKMRLFSSDNDKRMTSGRWEWEFAERIKWECRRSVWRRRLLHEAGLVHCKHGPHTVILYLSSQAQPWRKINNVFIQWVAGARSPAKMISVGSSLLENVCAEVLGWR